MIKKNDHTDTTITFHRQDTLLNITDSHQTMNFD